MTQYRKTQLENGIRIVSERLDHFRSVALGIWVNVGSREEVEKENGISHFIEHMIFKGTQARTALEIAKELDAIGGFSNAFTGKENTCFHSRVLDKHFATLADVLSDIFLNSTFDPGDMDRERQVILQEINMVEDSPEEHIHVLFNELFWKNHALGMSVLGTDETVAAINKETVLSYIDRFYTPDRIAITAAGNVDHDAIVEFFRPLFNSLGSSNNEPPMAVPKPNAGTLCHQKDLEQVHLCLGGEAPHLKAHLRFAAAILNTILGGSMSSLLFQEIREKRGLAYSVYSFLSAYVDTGLMGVYVATDPGAVNRVLKVINREIRKIQQQGITQVDLDAAREHLVGGILLSSESPDSRMMRLAKNEYIYGKYVSYEEIVSELEKVTVDEVVTVARDAFKSNGISLVTLGPVDEAALDLNYLQFN